MTSNMPDVTVEVAWDSGYQTAAASRTWTDVSTYVEAASGLDIARGRGDQWSAPQPSRLSLTLDNRDGRFTPENAAGAYYPNVKKGRPIRVSVAASAIVTDSFDRADNAASLGSADTGQAWTVANTGGAASTGGILSNRGYFSAATVGQQSYATVDASAADVSVEVTLPVAYTSAGLAWRYQNVSNTFAMTKTIAYRRVGGVQTTVLTFSTPFTTGDTVKVVVSGNNHEVFRNGASVGSYVDANMNTQTKHGLVSAADTGARFEDFSVSSGATSDRFMGYVDEWPVEWPDGSTATSTVTISATSRQARLGKTAPLKSIVEEEYLQDAPVLYFPLGEPSGATTAGNVASGRTEVLTTTQAGTGGTLEFGAGIGPGTDDLTAPILTPVDQTNGMYLLSTLLAPLSVTAQPFAIEAWVVCPSALAYNQSVMWLGGRTNLGLTLGVDGKASLSGGGVSVITTATSICDGAAHHLVGKFSWAAGSLTKTFIVDRVVVGSNSESYPTTASPEVTVSTIVVGGSTFTTPSNLLSGTVAHVALYTAAVADARFGQHCLAGSTGFAGEASGARIARIARIAGIPTAEVSVETGLSTSIAHKDTTNEQPISLMQDVATTEDGVVFDGKDGTLTFHSRSHRYGAVSAFTLSCTAGDVEGGIRPTLDDQHVTNDMTASRSGGVTIRSTNTASIAEYGYYKDTIEILTTSDNEVQSRADWEVNRFGTPRVTIPNLGVDLLSCSAALIAQLLAADIGTRFTVTGLPSQAPASTMDFFIEGIAEKIGAVSYGIEFNVSPAAYATVWLLDSATLSQLDSTTVLGY